MRKRSKQINLYLSDRELKQLEQLSEQAGLSQAAVIRALLMKQEIKAKPPEQYVALLRELSRIGANINQIAKVANSERRIEPEELARVQEMLGEIWREVKGR